MPPKVVNVLLRWCLPPGRVGASILGDLHQEYQAQEPGLRRDIWYLGIALSLGTGYSLQRIARITTRLTRRTRRRYRPWPLVYDVRQAARTLVRRPLYSITAVATLALGVGFTTAIYTVVDAVLIRQLPYERPGELVTVWNTYPTWRGHEVLDRLWDRIWLSYPEYEAWRDGQDVFSAVAIYGPSPKALTGAGNPAEISVGRASSGLFSLLGVEPQLGRFFLPGEEGPAAPRLAVLSDGIWRGRFGSDPDVTGRTVTLDGAPYEIIGVLPRGFRLRSVGREVNGGANDVWIPVGSDGAQLHRGNHVYEAIGRLKRGVTISRATAASWPLLRGDRTEAQQGVRIIPRKDEESRYARAPMLLLFLAVGILLLVGCANVATLMIGETATRRDEFATRMVLGAGRGRIARQLLTESVVLGVLGAAGGAAIGVWGTQALVHYAPSGLRLPDQIGINWRVLVFGAALGILAGLLFGTGPALATGRSGLEQELRSKSAGMRPTGWRAQRLVITLQMALSVVLIVAAGLSSRTLTSLLRVEPGFRIDGITAVHLRFPGSRYPGWEQPVQAARAVADAVRSIPGVEAVTGTSTLPFSGHEQSSSFEIEGREELPGGKMPEANRRAVLPDFHETLHIPVLAGRALTAQDRASGRNVVLVSEAMARQFWPNESPIGTRIRRNGQWWGVVGIVGDVLHSALDGEVKSTYYFPYAQSPTRLLTLVVLSDRNPAELTPLIREAIWSVDPALPADEVMTMRDLVAQSAADQRYRAVLLSAFAIFALVLSAVGVFGVTVRSVAVRNRELGIRAALGARAPALVGMVLRQHAVAIGAGIALGIAVTLAVSRALSHFLFGVSPQDAVSYVGAAVLLGTVGLLASYLPARRAATVDPMETLRVE